MGGGHDICPPSIVVNRRRLLAAIAFGLLLERPASAQPDEPTRWEELFFPFPIVGAPPQLEQQAQVFDSYFQGRGGSANVTTVELGYIATPHLGLVATVPLQIGIDRLPSGFGDAQLSVQYLTAGSLELDDMLSLGVMGTFPTGQTELSQGDYFVGPFAYAAQRFFRHLILEANLTTLLPIVHGDSSRQILATGLVSVLVTQQRSTFPVYLQVEANEATYLGGSAGTRETVFVTPEVFLGPFATPISNGTRVAAGVSFNAVGDPVHARTYTLTASFDIPNRYGY